MQSENDNNMKEGDDVTRTEPGHAGKSGATEGFKHMAPLEEVDESDSELSQLTEAKIPSPVIQRGSKNNDELRSSNNNSPTEFLSTSQASLGSLSSSTRLQLGEVKPPPRLQHKSIPHGSAEMHAAPALRPVHAPSLGPSTSHKSLNSLNAAPAPGPLISPRHHNKFSPSKEDAHSTIGLHHHIPHAPLGEIKQHNRLDVPPLGEIKHAHAHSPDAKEPKSARSLTDSSPLNSARALAALNVQHSPSAQHNSLPSPKLSPVAQLRKAVAQETSSVDKNEESAKIDSTHESPPPRNDIVADPAHTKSSAASNASPSVTTVSVDPPPLMEDLSALDSSQVVKSEGEPGVKDVEQIEQAHRATPASERTDDHSNEKKQEDVSASQESPLPPPRPSTLPSPPGSAGQAEKTLGQPHLVPPHTPVRGALGSGSKSSRFNRIHQSGGHSPPPLSQLETETEPELESNPQPAPQPVPQAEHHPDEHVKPELEPAAEPVVTHVTTRSSSQPPPPLPMSEVVPVSASSRQSSPRSATSSRQVSPRQGSPRLQSPRGQGSALHLSPPGQAPHTPHALFKKNSQSNMSVAGTVNTERSFGTTNRSVHSVTQASNSYEASYNKAASDLRTALMRLDSDVASSKTMVRNIFRKFDVDEHGELTAKELKSFVLSPELGLFNSDDPRALKFATMLMEQIDINGDGSVSMSELENFLWPRTTVTSTVENTPSALPSTIPLMFQSPWERQHAPKPSELKEIGIVIDFTRTAVRNHVSSVAALGSDEAILQEFAKFAKATLKRGMLDTRLVKKAFLNIRINEFGRCLYQEEVDQLVASIDCNDDGVVSAQEFKHWLFPAHKQEEHDSLATYLKKYLDEVFSGDVWQMFRAFCNGSDVCYKTDFILVLKALDKNISKQEALAVANKISTEKAITMAHFSQALNISMRALTNADASSVNISQSGSMDADSAAFGTPRTRRRRRRNNEQSSRLSTLDEEAASPIEGALFQDEDGEKTPLRRKKLATQSESLLPDETGDADDNEENSDAEMSDDASELSFDSALEDARPVHFLASSTAPGSGGKHAEEPVVEMDPSKVPSERELQRVRELLYGEKGKALQANLAATNASFNTQLSELEIEPLEGIEPVRRTVGLTPTQLTALGYSGHAGRWRGHPFDTWSCCNTALLKCPLGDASAFSPNASSPNKIRTSLDSSTGSLFYKTKSVPFVPAGRSPAKSPHGLMDLRQSTSPPVSVRRKSQSPHKQAEKPVRTKPSPAQARLAAQAASKKLAPPSPKKAQPLPNFNQELHITPSKLQVRQSKAQPVISRAPSPPPRRASSAVKSSARAPKSAPAPSAPKTEPAPSGEVSSGTNRISSSAPKSSVSKTSASRKENPKEPVPNVPLKSTPYVPVKSAPVTATFVVNVPPRAVSPQIPPDDVELFQHLYAPSPVVHAQKVELQPRNVDLHPSNSSSTSQKTLATAVKAAELLEVSSRPDVGPPSPAYANTLRALREELNETRTSTYLDDFEFGHDLREEEPKLRIHQELLKQVEDQEAASEQCEEVKTSESAADEKEPVLHPPVPASPHHAFHDEWARYQKQSKSHDAEEEKVSDKHIQGLETAGQNLNDLSVTGSSLQFASRVYSNLQSGDDYDTAELRAKYGAPLLIGSVDDPFLPGESLLPNKYFKAPPERRTPVQRSQSAPPSRSPRASRSNHDSFFAARPVPPRAVVRQEVGAKRPEEIKNISKMSIGPPVHHDGVWLPTSPLHGVSFYRNNHRRHSRREKTSSPVRARSASPTVHRHARTSSFRPSAGLRNTRVIVNGELKSVKSQPAARIYPSTPSTAGRHGQDVSSMSYDQTPYAAPAPRSLNPEHMKALFDPPSVTYGALHHLQQSALPLPAHLQYPSGYVPPVSAVPSAVYPSYPTQPPPPQYVYPSVPSPAYSIPQNPTPSYPHYAVPYSPYGYSGYMPYGPSAYGVPPTASVYATQAALGNGPHAVDTWWEQIRAKKRQHEIQGYDSVHSKT